MALTHTVSDLKCMDCHLDGTYRTKMDILPVPCHLTTVRHGAQWGQIFSLREIIFPCILATRVGRWWGVFATWQNKQKGE